MLRQNRSELNELFERLRTLKDQDKKNTQEYHEVFNQMAKTFEKVKELEQQHSQTQNKLFLDPQQTQIRMHADMEGVVGLSNQPQQAGMQWHESQLQQLNSQIQAFKSLQTQNPIVDVGGLQLADSPYAHQVQQFAVNQRTQNIYRDRFESNHLMFFHDLWEYVDRKLESGGTATVAHPADINQMASEMKETDQPYYYMKRTNEIDEINQRSLALDRLADDENAPEEIQAKARYYQNLIELRPLQVKLREQILTPYFLNEQRYEKVVSQTQGDLLFQNQLVDRNFYKRAKLFANSKKEARALDRFEHQMRCGSDARRGARRKEFLKELLDHFKDFQEFHKRQQGKTRKMAASVKAHLDKKEQTAQNQIDKQERRRIQALKDNDIDAYINLISTQKNSRIMNILEQTHQYLQNLGAKVSLQKSQNSQIAKKKQEIQRKQLDPDEQLEEGYEIDATGQVVKKKDSEDSLRSEDQFENDDDDDEDKQASKIKSSLKNSSKVYYNMTHTISEEIDEQPHLLNGGKLKSYQLFGLNWMISLYNNNLNGILADEMGLGKTIQTISLFAYLIGNKSNDGPFLVVVPLTTINNWMNEFALWAPDIRIIVYKGKKSERPILAQHLKNDKFNVVLTTYEYILNDKSTLCKIHWQYIVVDEGHRMKNTKSKFALTLGQQYISAHRLLLTGTPLQNNLSELWALLNFLLPTIFASCEEFKKWFDRPLSKTHPLTHKQFAKNAGQDQSMYDLSEEEQLLIINRLHQVLRPFLLRRVKTEVEKELPPKKEILIKVELSAWQRIVYNGIVDQGKLALDPSSGRTGTKGLTNALMQMRNICNHPYLFLKNFEYNDPIIISSSGKFELLDRILPKFVAAGHKVLVFSQFVKLLSLMRLFLNQRGHQVLTLDGSMDQPQRARNMELFADPNSVEKIFLLSTRAGGHGLNLQMADTVVIFDSDFNPQMDEQAKDRVHRIGQKNEVRVFRLVSNQTIEENILSKAMSKKDLDNKIIQAGMFNDKATDAERNNTLRDLIAKDKKKEPKQEPGEGDENGDDEDSDDEIFTDAELNYELARSEPEFELFTNMDRDRYAEEKRDEKIAELKERRPEIAHKSDDKINYRLVQEWEVPEWIDAKKEEEKEELLKGAKLGKRQRKEVNYCDVISDIRWAQIVDAGGDPDEENDRIVKRRKMGLPDEEEEASVVQTPQLEENVVNPEEEQHEKNEEQKEENEVNVEFKDENEVNDEIKDQKDEEIYQENVDVKDVMDEKDGSENK